VRSTADRISPHIAGRYAIEHLLGAGATAEVFLARDLSTGAPVALKVLKETLDDEVAEARFRQEIAICRELEHPGIVGIVDAGVADGALYYVMEFVDGRSLRDRMEADGALPIDDALRISREVASALAYAHERAILHRDVKPENIMLGGGSPSRAVLTDFGLARALDGDGSARLTRTGLAVGTPLYMCPEQAFGEADARSDQYALGCVLHEMLAGEPPFSATSFVALMARHAQSPPPPLRVVRPTVPEWLEQTVLRTLAKVPADRFASCAELAATLAAGATAAAVSVPQSAPRSIAVLPFTDASREGDNEYLCDGIAEELITALSKVRGLRVLPRASAFSLRGRELDVREAGRQLGVTALLTGSLRTSGGRVRVNVALTGTRDGFQLWADTFDGTMDDVFAFEDTIATRVVDALELHLPADARVAGAAPVRVDAAAHDAYMRGRHFWARRTSDSLNRATTAFRSAIDAAPSFALAHAALALAHATQGIYGALAPLEVMPLARAAAEHALALDPQLGDALAALGCVQAVYDRDFVRAEETFRRAATIDRDNPTVHHWYAAQLLLPLGRVREAQRALRRARALDPLSTTIGVTIGLAHSAAGDLTSALDAFAQVRTIDPHFSMEPFFSGLALTEAGRLPQAMESLERAVVLSGRSAESLSALARVHALSGEAAEARELLAELNAQLASRYVSPALLAEVHAALGEPDEAFAWMERALEVRSAELIWAARRFAPIRSDPRWTGVLARIGGPAS
jgi:eukaryotic-like serine/threonine-protein kinase